MVPLVIWAFGNFVTGGQCLSFLFVPMPQMSSHLKSMVPIAEGLLKKGHKIEFIWGSYNPNVRLNKEHLAETFIQVDTNDPKLRDVFVHENDTAFHASFQGVKHPIYETHHAMPWILGAMLCKEMVKTGAIDEFIAIRRKDFDVILIDTHFSPCGFLLAEKMKLPYIMLSTSYLLVNTLAAKGAPLPVASYPQVVYSPYDYLDFKWRLFGFYCRTVAEVVYTGLDLFTWYKLWGIEPQMRDFSVRTFERHSLITMSVSSPQLDFPHPHQWDIHYMESHCPSAKSNPLPLEFAKFAEDVGSKGTIIVAFGHMVRWRYPPASDWVNVFFGVAKLLPQYRFVMQYDGDLIDAPSNVLLSEWIPQKELLHHHKTVGFVSHMGYKSYLEAICSKVPIIAFPVYAEQPKNALIAEKYLEVAETVHKATVTPEKLALVIQHVANDAKYKKNAARISALIDDQMIDPIELAVFKIEYAHRHSNKIHILRSQAAELTWFVYFGFDVLTLFIGAVTAVLYACFLVVKMLLC